MGWESKLKNPDRLMHAAGQHFKKYGDVAKGVKHAGGITKVKASVKAEHKVRHEQKHQVRREKLAKALVEAGRAKLEVEQKVEPSYVPLVQRVEACIAAIKEMENLDFINQTIGGWAEVKAIRVTLETRLNGSAVFGGATPSYEGLLAVKDELPGAMDQAKELLERAGKAGEVDYDEMKDFTDLLDNLFKLAMSYGDYAGLLHRTVNEAAPAFEAFFAQVARLAHAKAINTKDRKILHRVFTIVNEVVDSAAHFVPPSYKAIPGALKFLAEAGEQAGEEYLLRKQAEEARKGVEPGREFLDLLPLEIAEWLYAGHKANVRLLIKGVGIAGEEIPGWSIISNAIQLVVDGYLDRKLELARAALAQRENQGNKELPKGMFGTIKEELEKELTAEKVREHLKPSEMLGKMKKVDFIKKIFPKEEQKPGDLEPKVESFINKALELIIPKLIDLLPIDPAQEVSGDMLTGYVRSALVEQFPKWVGGGQHESFEAVKNLKPVEKAPTEDKYGRPVKRTDAAETQKRDDGTVRYYAAVEIKGNLVWGYINPADGTFISKEVDRDAFKDWSKRHITASGYTDQETEAEHRGQWYKPFDHAYLFVEGDKHEWAGESAPVGNGPTKKVMDILEHTGYLQPSAKIMVELDAV